jgi:hypothetical protein
MWITFGVALAISAAAYFVMLLYVQAVRRESGRPAQVTQPAPGGEKGAPRSRSTTIGSLEIQTESPDGARRPGPPQSLTFHHVKTAFRRSACFYALGGSVVAATTTGLLFCSGFIRSRPHHRGSRYWLVMAAYFRRGLSLRSWRSLSFVVLTAAFVVSFSSRT